MRIFRISLVLFFASMGPLLVRGYDEPLVPYAPAVGQVGSTAVAYNDPKITGWASDVTSIEYGTDVAVEGMQPEMALGPAGSVDPGVVVLGRGGVVVLEFDSYVRDGEGADFAVFENAFSDGFLELAYFEVSTDGLHFVRFPNYSLTEDPVGGFGQVSPSYVHGLAGKYRAGYGTPFDLSDLKAAYAAILVGYSGFSEEFSEQLLNNFPYLDFENIRYVRLIDIPGDGLSKDCQGFPIYDPYPTIITAGFDLDAVGVMHSSPIKQVGFVEWSTGFGLYPDPGFDYDSDGWNQYMEYLFGSDPADGENRPILNQSNSQGRYLLDYFRNPGAQGSLIVEYSFDGESWTAVADSVIMRSSEVEIIGSRSLLREQVTIESVTGPLLLRFTTTPIIQ